jgi:hypothetical protein
VLERLILAEAKTPEEWRELVTPMERHLASKSAELISKTNAGLPSANRTQEAAQAARSFLVAAHRVNFANHAILSAKRAMEKLHNFLKNEVVATKHKLRSMNWKKMTHAEAMRQSVQLQHKSEKDASALNSLAAVAVVATGKVSRAVQELELAVAHPSVRKMLALSRPLDKVAAALHTRALKIQASEWRIHDATEEAEAGRLYAKRYVTDAASWSTKNAQVIIEDRKDHVRMDELLPTATEETN